MLAIISISMKELDIIMFSNNNLLLFSYINTKSCFIKVSCILIKNFIFFPSSFIAFKSFLKIIDVVRPFSFFCEKMGGLYNIFRISFKKLSRPTFSNCGRRRIWRMILCKNSIYTILKLPISHMSSMCFFTFNYIV